MRKKILATVLGATICLGSMTGCTAGFKREVVDMKSNWNGGMKYEKSHYSIYSRW